MATAINRTTYEYRESIHTPHFDPAFWLINPNLSGVSGVPEKYWKVVGDTVVEMSKAEKDAVDAANVVPNLPVESFAESSTGTTSANLQPKASLKPGVMSPSKKHQIEWYCEVNNSSTTGRTEVEVAYDGNIIANPSMRSRHREDWIPVHGFIVLNEGVSMTEVTLKFKRLNKGTSTVRRARLKVTEIE